LLSAKQETNDKLQGNVLAYLRYGGAVNNQIKKAFFAESVNEKQN